ncbi:MULTISPECIES: hypothetical protein [Sporosarcina]|uniref:hypothetical protein n=1 Tax=Sporosarcina TaxID=1569 RepID=UPI00058C7175|nr:MULTISPECIES: hypothetical protein [Sporosarcina]WJY27563.1 hypothetical protein QWT68_00665 [Sporosarcina sp. 0.2-SM1T-5]
MSSGITALLILLVLFIMLRNKGDGDMKPFTSLDPEERKRIQAYARETRETASDIETVKILRQEFGLTLLQAKQAVDSVK